MLSDQCTIRRPKNRSAGVDLRTKREHDRSSTEESNMSDLVHDLVSFISIGAFITTLALWLVAV
jgi:hypothetical protein